MVQQTQRVLHAIMGQLSGVANELTDFRRELRLLERAFFVEEVELESDDLVSPDDIDDDSTTPETLLESLQRDIEGRLPGLVGEMVERCNDRVLVARKGLRAALSTGGKERNALPDEMRQVGRVLLLEDLKGMDVTSMLFDSESDEQDLEDILQNAMPAALQAGGGRRVLALVPNEESAEQIRKTLSEHLELGANVMVHEDCDFVIAQEAQDIPPDQIAVRIIEGRKDYAEYATRFHTRTDVNWSGF